MGKPMRVADNVARFFERLGALITTAVFLVAGTGDYLQLLVS
jgi:hypothetical protein